MQPDQIYQQLLQSLENGELNKLERQIFHLLKENPAGLSRQDLVFQIQGYWPDTLDGNTDDRKNRKAIQRLRERLVPIVSTSGQPGYRLDISKDGVDQMLAELRAKKRLLEQQIESTLKFYEIPIAYLTDPKEVKQLEMI
jgi:hypothetical protein